MISQDIPCTCEAAYCNLPATVQLASNPGEASRSIPPPTPDTANLPAANGAGGMIWRWYEVTCVGGHRTLVNEPRYAEIVGSSGKGEDHGP
jgi:hypothetical protein